MNLKVICMLNGLPLWSAAYPETDDDNSIISGFLSAINSFARATEGHVLKNMNIGEHLWTFVNVHGIDDFFLTSVVDLAGDPAARNYKTKLIEKMVSEISDEFTTRFPKSYFGNDIHYLAAFSDIQAFANEKLKEYHEVLTRYEKHDIKWLARFEDSEKLFTATLDNNAVFVIGDQADTSKLHDDVTKLQATLEFISGHPASLVNFIDGTEIASSEKRAPELIYLVNQDQADSMVTNDTSAIVDLQSKRIVSGPSPNTIATSIVKALRDTVTDDHEITDFLPAQVLKGDNRLANFESLFSGRQAFETEFRCKLCDSLVKFNMNDESTYIEKKLHQSSFFGMELITFKVAHLSVEQMHVNSILVDSKGVLHGLIEVYSITITKNEQEPEIPGKKELIVLADEEPPLENHRAIETMFVLNTKNAWIMEVVRPPVINSLEMGRILMEKYQEVIRIYSNPPSYLTINVADKQYDLWILDSMIIAANFLKKEGFEIFDALFKEILAQQFNDREWLTKREQLNLILQFLEKASATQTDIPVLLRILTDDLLFSDIHIKYLDQIPRIVERLNKEFSIAKEVLDPLLRNKITLMDLLRKNYLLRSRELIQMVDFINMRKILG
jgi:hypothetical protein